MTEYVDSTLGYQGYFGAYKNWGVNPKLKLPGMENSTFTTNNTNAFTTTNLIAWLLSGSKHTYMRNINI